MDDTISRDAYLTRPDVRTYSSKEDLFTFFYNREGLEHYLDQSLSFLQLLNSDPNRDAHHSHQRRPSARVPLLVLRPSMKGLVEEKGMPSRTEGAIAESFRLSKVSSIPVHGEPIGEGYDEVRKGPMRVAANSFYLSLWAVVATQKLNEYNFGSRRRKTKKFNESILTQKESKRTWALDDLKKGSAGKGCMPIQSRSPLVLLAGSSCRLQPQTSVGAPSPHLEDLEESQLKQLK
ncbi:myosin 1 [Corchorus olitorius]|uniref:Myosin 1 n=1 Tax=Corchorus olitorius TaxID=93759 RepID=A0A1R3KV81_9ROSI|nr:myosin 1 [Corchorus olitorius]